MVTRIIKTKAAVVPISLAVIALDQATKALVRATLALHSRTPIWPGLFDLTHVRNRGMAFGLFNGIDGAWLRWVLVAVAVGAVLVIWSYARREQHRLAVLVAFGAILGGALGNLIDRLRFGYVVDFLLAHWGSHEFPAFNAADSAITMGGILLFLALAREDRHSSQQQDTLAAGPPPPPASGGTDTAADSS